MKYNINAIDFSHKIGGFETFVVVIVVIEIVVVIICVPTATGAVSLLITPRAANFSPMKVPDRSNEPICIQPIRAHFSFVVKLTSILY